ncbi:hypothetical protein FACS18942_09800 [Planctomycetales bacterium]|nr:hypothetical protein FACS18942_09800 [Planctomycetales bacterium]
MESQKQPAANKQPLLSNKEVDDLFFWAGVIRWEFLPDKLAFDIPTVVLEHFGYSKDETPLSMERWLQLIHPDDQQTAKYNFQELIQGRIPYFEMKYRIRTANGEYRYFFSRGGLNSLHSNPLNACISGTLQDVTESESAVRSLHKRDKLLKAINTAAGIILNDYETGFDSCMKEIIFLLGEATNSDRCIIWKNTTDSDGQDCAEIAYEWSPNAKPQQHDKNRNRFRYQESLPFFKQSLQAGGCISSYVKDLPEPERSCLAAGNITSILLAPILVHNDFWGFIALDNCRDGQIWDKVECDLMNSVGGIIASSIKRKNVEAVLSEERQTLNWIVDAAHHPMMISSDGVISRINKAAKKVFGLDIGDNVSSVYPPELNRDEVLQSIREAGFFYRQSVSFNCADGQHRYFSAQILPFKLFNEKQLILWANDITAIKETEQKLIAERQKAENALKVKSEFLARMSHEIRTPMNAVIGMIYLCLQTELADNQKDYLVKATTAANNLLGIINDILDFSKIEANRIELESITFSIRKLVGDVSD